MDYQQPDFYHFAEDSIRLVQVATKFSREFYHSRFDVLDLCAGSGVCGIEFALNNQNVSKIDFVEKNEKFIPYLKTNLGIISCPHKVHHLDYKDHEKKYDLVLCNPPYFSSEKNRLCEDLDKRRAKFISKIHTF